MYVLHTGTGTVCSSRHFFSEIRVRSRRGISGSISNRLGGIWATHTPGDGVGRASRLVALAKLAVWEAPGVIVEQEQNRER